MTNPQAFTSYFRPYVQTFLKSLDSSIKCVEKSFNNWTQSIDFVAFCVIYALILIWLLRRLNRERVFRPVNKELVDWKTKIKKSFKAFIVSLPIVKQIVQSKFNKALDQMEIKVIKQLQKDRDPLKSKKLPIQGMKKQNIQARLNRWVESEEKRMFSGKMSGMVYIESGNFYKEVSDFAAKFLYQNPLHVDAFKELAKIEAQMIKMTSSLISDKKTYGLLTSGGSQSLILSLYAYKKFYKKDTPNIVVPNTIHAAIDKGAAYFNIQIRKARLNERYEVDVSHMSSLIDHNTIALYGSYPNYPHGIIDPIQDIAKLALKHKIGFHVDGCLGGFVSAFLKQHQKKFTLDIDGVTSITLDHHKFGLAPKGISTIFFKTEELRHSAYFIYTEWVGGIYMTPSMCGSRSGFASAGAWYALTHVGRKQYTENALEIVKTTKHLVQELKKIEGVTVYGNPELCVFAFDISVVDIYSLASHLEKTKGWHFSSIHLPKGVHFCVTPANYQNAREKLSKDIVEGIEYLKKNPLKQTTTAAIYGASASLPGVDMSDDMLKCILKACFK